MGGWEYVPESEENLHGNLWRCEARARASLPTPSLAVLLLLLPPRRPRRSPGFDDTSGCAVPPHFLYTQSQALFRRTHHSVLLHCQRGKGTSLNGSRRSPADSICELCILVTIIPPHSSIRLARLLTKYRSRSFSCSSASNHQLSAFRSQHRHP